MPKYTSPCRHETSREATFRAAMTVTGRFKADGCRQPEYHTKADGTKVFVRFVQVNRKFRRSGGRAS
jgi:hypothetical protein